MQFSSIWPIDRTLSGATTPGQSGPGSDGLPQSSSITGTSPSDCLVSYPGHSFAGVLPLRIDAVYSPSCLGKWYRWSFIILIFINELIKVLLHSHCLIMFSSTFDLCKHKKKQWWMSFDAFFFLHKSIWWHTSAFLSDTILPDFC